MGKIAQEDDRTALRMGSVLRQSAVLFGGNIFLMAGGYGFKIYLARTVGAEGIGLFTLADSLVSFALLFVVWELQQAVFRFLPEFRSKGNSGGMRRLIWASIWHVLLLSLAGLFLLAVTRSFWARYFGNPALAGVLLFFAVMLPFRALEMVIRLISRAYKEVLRVTAIQTFISFPFKIIVSVFLITGGLGLVGWLWGELASAVVSVLLLGWLAFHLTPREARRPLLTVKQDSSVYLFLASMVGIAFIGVANGKLGVLLIGSYLDPKSVGVYSVAVTTAGLITMLQSALNGVFAPHITEMNASGSKAELALMFYRVTRWNLMATLPVFIIYVAMADQLMAVFGPDFTRGAAVLAILSVGGLINIGTGPVGTILKMTGHERPVVFVQIIQFVITTTMLLLLLPVMGLTGAAIAQCIGTIFLYVALYLRAKKLFPLYLFDGNTLKLLLSALVMGVLTGFGSVILREYLSPVPLILASLTALYSVWGLLVLRFLFDEKDREFAGEAVRGIRLRFAAALK